MNAPTLSCAEPLGQMLLRRGHVNEDQLRIALREQQQIHAPIGKLLVALGFISEATLRHALAEMLGRPCVDLEHTAIDADALRFVPHELAKRHRLLPLSFDATAKRLTLAIADVDDIVALDRVRVLLDHDVSLDLQLASETAIDHAIDQNYGHDLSIDGLLHEIDTGEVDANSLRFSVEDYRQPVVRLIDAVLGDAVKQRASDIHFEPEANFLRIRYRIDGTLRQIRALHHSHWPAMAVRLKVLAALDIAETRAPQDGRFSLSIGARPIDFRVAVQPTLHGENIVLRVLDRQKGIVTLDELGLHSEQRAQLEAMINRPEGLILLTGPTGSGKTTTLYSLLRQINSERVNIMTLEDPVEYPMAMVRQTSVGDASRLDFANGIRSLMRQDPDVILVGEIRDTDTAEMALRAAMTGHLVLTTLHSNSAIGAIPRLLDIGIRPDILAGNIVGIVAQRLLRRLCPHCRAPYVATAHERQRLALPDDAPAPTLHRATGCAQCGQHGYRGRLAIMEILPLNDTLDDLVAQRASTGDLRRTALAQGFRSLADDGRRRVLDGSTSLEELARVVDLGARR
ncbi:Flp pilus assembly complex ATPase component TadA [Rhodocyclus tenuis]|uniref:Flp pilus assembly complex ATPase component TadA n=1 Tax=Rhodocyclus gracilis TaxID=2929842 RepID=A0ABX0WJF7_9RHOO|nr:GspE/PulE family protein [Rhodocyclus gracilis]MRD73277.1 secretion system protein E [Rhodocyclus gracilis]NJA88942.1 Flp pilus assembly complex ATPase component TadA [Rhodocyclus gracilis]